MDQLSRAEVLSIPPVERDSADDLRQLISQARSNPLFKAVLSWIDGAVVILNRNRQIVMASAEFATLAGAEDAESLLGQRVGEALGCVHAGEGPDGCSTSAACRFCGALRAIVASRETDVPIDSGCRIFHGRGEHAESTKWRVRASRTRDQGYDFSVLAFQRPEIADQALTSAQTVFAPPQPDPLDFASYSTIRKIGSGGMGEVYLVKDANGRELALKTLRADLAQLRTVNRRFHREAKVARVLDHPHIVKTYLTKETEEGLTFIVSEYCPGGSTSERLQNRGPIEPATAVKWLSEAASALSYIWSEHRTIHRDIKPDNLLLGANDEIKITDFGIAKRLLDGDGKLTMTGNVLGTVYYLSPEQAMGETDLDVRTDLYALGATFFELLVGAPPFDGPNPGEIITAKLFQRPPRLDELDDALPAALCDCVDRLLERELDDRFGSPDELLAALEPIAEAVGAKTAATEPAAE